MKRCRLPYVSRHRLYGEIAKSYTEHGGCYAGYFNDFPRHITEGETIEEMLSDRYERLNLA